MTTANSALLDVKSSGDVVPEIDPGALQRTGTGKHWGQPEPSQEYDEVSRHARENDVAPDCPEVKARRNTPPYRIAADTVVRIALIGYRIRVLYSLRWI